MRYRWSSSPPWRLDSNLNYFLIWLFQNFILLSHKFINCSSSRSWNLIANEKQGITSVSIVCAYNYFQKFNSASIVPNPLLNLYLQDFLIILIYYSIYYALKSVCSDDYCYIYAYLWSKYLQNCYFIRSYTPCFPFGRPSCVWISISHLEKRY